MRRPSSPPGPRGFKAFGFLGDGSLGGTLEFLQRTAREYGPVASFRILHKRIYLVDDPDLIQEILVLRQHEFVRDSGATMLRELVGDGLLTREEPLHKERRRVLQPAFHKDQIASYASIMVAEANRMANAWTNEEVIDVRQQMRRLTLSIVGATLFGTEFTEEASAVAGVLDGVVKRATRIAPAFALFEPAALLYRRIFPGARSLLFAKERAALEQLIEPILAERRERQGRDVMSLLLSSGISDTDIQNEVITFVLAGHETTATALTWTWKLLAEHPGGQQSECKPSWTTCWEDARQSCPIYLRSTIRARSSRKRCDCIRQRACLHGARRAVSTLPVIRSNAARVSSSVLTSRNETQKTSSSRTAFSRNGGRLTKGSGFPIFPSEAERRCVSANPLPGWKVCWLWRC